MRSSRGVALVIVLIALAVFSALGLGLVLSTTSERMASANHEASVHAGNAADAGLQLAVRELAAIADWEAVLRGTQQSRFVSGVPPVDLDVVTNQLTCGRSTPCTEALRQTSTSDRPWGSNNPVWQVFLRAPLAPLLNIPAASADMYIVVWIGDDAREMDSDPLTDAVAGTTGHGVVRAHAEVFTARGGRRAVEADLVRQPAGIRVQSWRDRSGAIP
jgi:hypothetical protein